MNIKYVGVIAAIIIVGFLTLVFFRTSGETQSQKVKVVTSFYPVYYFAQQVGGDKADVLNITPAGAEPHDYEPTPQDLANIQNSDLLILNGDGFEPWAEAVQNSVDKNRTKVIAAGAGLASLEATHEEHEEHEDEGSEEDHVLDPHVWLSPALASRMVDSIAAGFIASDTENSAYYRARADALKQKLEVLDAEFQAGLSSCSKDDIITSHAAFGYIASAYKLRQVAIGGLSIEEEPSPRELAEIAKFARDNDVRYIFFETLVSPKLSQTIATEVGAQTLVLNPLEGLTSEEMAQGKDYFTEMRVNLANLKIALECSPR
jgi:zinc transport system substrate-binding protein